ncbi:MAG: hypothetical protein ABI539_03550 [Acidobacteriota bacterium]
MIFIAVASGFATAQAVKGTVKSDPAGEKFAAVRALADRTVKAHGGSKLKAMGTLVIAGSVDVTMSGVPQAIPATFITIFAGDKYRIEINNPFQPLKQAFDGVTTSSTIRGGFMLPPLNRLGFPLLARIGDTGFIVTELPAEKRKRKGFRVTSPEGFLTDFYLDEKTDQIKAYDANYVIEGRTVTTSVEIDKFRIVEGIVVPEKYVQRFDMEQMTVYANFKAKEITVNTVVPNTLFTV